MSQPAPATTEAAPEPKGLELFLLKLRYKEGRLLTVEGNSPILLDDPSAAWVVYAGKVDVFVVGGTEGQAGGPRRHLLRGEVGHVLCGLAPDPATGTALLAVGMPGTRLLRLPLARLRAMAANPENVAVIAGLLDSWIADLAGGCVRTLPPKEALVLDPSTSLTLPGGGSGGPRRGVLWATPTEGQVRPLGRADLPLISSPTLFPLTRQTWLQADDSATLRACDTPTYFTRDPEWAGLAVFHDHALRLICANRAGDGLAEESWLRERAAIAHVEVADAVAGIAAVLDPQAATFAPSEGSEADPLFAACQLVGQAAEIALVAPADDAADRPVAERLRAWAAATNIRTRPVTLAGPWWRKDNGPLLGFRAEGGQPVALLPLTPDRYVLHDPQARTRLPLTPALAQTLAPYAYTFYRPLPSGAQRVWSLLAFGIRGSERDVAMVVAMGLAAGALGVLTPLATGYIFDNLLPGSASGLLLQIGLGLVAIALAVALFQLARSIAVLRVESRLDARLQAAVWDRLLTLPVPFYRDYSAGDLGSRAMGISAIRQTLSGPVITTILSGIFSLFNLGVMFYLDVRLGLVALGLVVVLVVLTAGTGAVQVRYERQLAEAEGASAGLVLQLINGIAKFRVAGAEGRAFALWAAQFTAQKRLAYQGRTVQNALAVLNAVYPIITAMVLFALVATSLDAGLTTGAFLAFLAAFSQLLLAGIDLSGALISILSIIPDYEGAKPILRATPEVDLLRAAPGELVGEIEATHLTFRYAAGGVPILKDVSLRIAPGEFVALVGPSGSGKSTLFRLLLGFDTPEGGAVFYDGRDLARLDLRAVRAQIGVVLQNGKLLPGDLYSNIVGSTPATPDDAWEAAQHAGLADEIRQMPLGLQTTIGEGASTLSGGQRQRLLIARALVKKPRILFFDEATSALDNQTQAQVSRSLAALQATRIVIAHRLSTIIAADRILVLDRGEIVQTGTYAELIEQPGLFAELARRQIV